MDPKKIERAMRDEEFRNSLSEEELSQLPGHPAGEIELTDDELDNVVGGVGGFDLEDCSNCSEGGGCSNCTNRESMELF